MSLADRLKANSTLKSWLHYLIIPRGQARPRTWVSWFVNPFVHHYGRGARVCRRVRLDVLPSRPFSLGAGSTIEDFSVINNGVGAVRIGEQCRVGMSNVVIGPVTIGDQVIMAQNVVASGLNHGYEDITLPVRQQPVNTREIVIEDECWIGANVVITAGVRIGKHSVVAAGSIVTKDVPPYSVVAGNPARLIKHYVAERQRWEKFTPALLEKVPG